MSLILEPVVNDRMNSILSVVVILLVLIVVGKEEKKIELGKMAF